MLKKLKLGTGLWIGALLGLSGIAHASENLIGQPAPALSGQRADGGGLLSLNLLMKEVSFLKDAQGQFVEKDGQYVMQVKKNVVVLNFFATYCVPCIKEIPTYNRLFQKLRGQDVKLVYVNVDPEIDEAKARWFIQEKKVEVPMLLPKPEQTMKDYGVVGLPRIVVIDREGKVAQVITGFQEDLEKQLMDMVGPLLTNPP